MRRLLRALFGRSVQFLNGFFEGERLWGRVRLFFLLGLFLLPGLVGVAIVFPMQQAASEALYASYPFLKTGILAVLLPEPVLRFLALTFSWDTFRYALITLLAVSTALLVGASYVQDVKELRHFSPALRYLFASMFSISYPLLHIAEGQEQLEADEVNTLAEIGGPGFVVIAPGNAVLFERLHHPSNVRAEGSHFITRFESVKEIVDLNDQHWHVDQMHAISKDGLMVNVHDFNLRFRLWGSHRKGGITGRNPVVPYPHSIQAVRNLVYNRVMSTNGIPAWGQAVQSVVDGEIQNYIRKHTVDAVTAPSPDQNPRAEINQAIHSPEVRSKLRAIGTELEWVDIGHFSVEESVEEQRIQTWGSRWEGEAALLRARGEATRSAILERARAEAQAELLNRIAEGMDQLDIERDANPERMARLFLVKVMQVLEDLRRPYTEPPSQVEP